MAFTSMQAGKVAETHAFNAHTETETIDMYGFNAANHASVQKGETAGKSVVNAEAETVVIKSRVKEAIISVVTPSNVFENRLKEIDDGLKQCSRLGLHSPLKLGPNQQKQNSTSQINDICAMHETLELSKKSTQLRVLPSWTRRVRHETPNATTRLEVLPGHKR